MFVEDIKTNAILTKFEISIIIRFYMFMKKQELLIDFLAMIIWNSQKVKVKEG